MHKIERSICQERSMLEGNKSDSTTSLNLTSTARIWNRCCHIAMYTASIEISIYDKDFAQSLFFSRNKPLTKHAEIITDTVIY